MTYAAELEAEQWSRLCLAEGLRWAVPIYMLVLRGMTHAERRRRVPYGIVANPQGSHVTMIPCDSWEAAASTVLKLGRMAA